MKSGRFTQFTLDVVWVLFAQATVVLTFTQPDVAPAAWLITVAGLVGLFMA